MSSRYGVNQSITEAKDAVAALAAEAEGLLEDLEELENTNDDLENDLGQKIGHLEACDYTSKATHVEIIEHFVTRKPQCQWFH